MNPPTELQDGVVWRLPEPTPSGSSGLPVVALVAKTTALMADISAAGTNWLAPYEDARAASFRIERVRQAYLAAHWLVRVAAGQLLSMPAAGLRLAQRCPDCGGEHGPPRIVGQEGVHVSLSHADHWVAAVAARVPVAIDIEEWHKLHLPDLLGAGVFSASEQQWLTGLPDPHRARAATRVWAHKECRVKLGRLSLDGFGGCNLEELLAVLPLVDGVRHGVHPDGCRFTQWCSSSHAATAVIASVEPAAVATTADGAQRPPVASAGDG